MLASVFQVSDISDNVFISGFTPNTYKKEGHMKIDLEDTLRIVSTQLTQFQEMKEIAELTDSQFMRAEAIGGIIALEQIQVRLAEYAKSQKHTNTKQALAELKKHLENPKVAEAIENTYSK